MVVLKKKEKGECQIICQEPLEVVISEENFKNIWIYLFWKEGHDLMRMRLTETSVIEAQVLCEKLGTKPTFGVGH